MTPVKPRTPGSAHAAIAALIGQVGIDRACEVVGASASTVYNWTNPDAPGEASFHRIALLSELGGATACAEYLAMRAGGIFTLLAPLDCDDEMAEIFAEAAEEFGKAAADVARSFSPRSDGGAKMTPREALKVLADLDPLINTLGQMRALALSIAEAR